MLFKKKKFPKLTSREVDIMNILWTSGKPLIASEIADCRPDLTINTVQAVLRKLLKYQLVEVADIVYSGTVLSRSYRPTITSEEFAVHEVTSDYLAFEKTLSKPLLVSALLDTEEDPVKARESIDELQKIIYVFLTIFLYLLKCPQSLILSALRAFCFCGKPHISRSIFLYFRYQAWLKSW